MRFLDCAYGSARNDTGGKCEEESGGVARKKGTVEKRASEWQRGKKSGRNVPLVKDEKHERNAHRVISTEA